MPLNRPILPAAAAVVALLAGCGGSSVYDRASAQPPMMPSPIESDQPSVLGAPYSIAGKRYEPSDNASFDQVGYARVFGEEKRGSGTPSGEIVDPDLVQGAHQTLPMPSYVEVTHLDTGRTILVRINNRGPMTNKAVIELSPAAARELGIVDGSATAVRVRRVNPPAAEKAALRMGRAAAPRLDTPPILLTALRRQLREQGISEEPKAVEVAVADKSAKPAPPGKPAKAPAKPPATPNRRGADFDVPATPPKASAGASTQPTEPMGDPGSTQVVVHHDSMPPVTVTETGAASGPWFVQIGAFTTAARARAYGKKAGASVVRAGNVWRVRTGPYANEEAARAAVGQLRSKGYPGARATP